MPTPTRVPESRRAEGMLADRAVLYQDIFSVPLSEVPATRSVLIIVGGRTTHDPLEPD